ncbi:MAG: Holliday junction branch migration protein RuvA [Erysipelotrichaceae bacterium]|nr:Holliday junction branch migration protein RuvA [Erysipelotrichaceae bacterium]MDP3306215.1 Holliday junction branch migration protein RuvA [Erysipelotrichaceae bacterium]
MIAFIRGKVHAFGLDWVILDTQGVGYRIGFPRPEVLSLNTEVLLYTYQHIREDEVSLYGFLTMDELRLFEQLLSVKGLGPKTALNMMSASAFGKIISAIESGDVTFLRTMPGIGAKTASQIVLDLKGKLVESEKKDSKASVEIQDTVAALRSLGYKASELAGIEKYLITLNLTSVDELIKAGLQFLLKRKGGI